MEELPNRPILIDYAQGLMPLDPPKKKIGRPKGSVCSLAQKDAGTCRSVIACSEKTVTWVKVKHKRVSKDRDKAPRFRCRCQTEDPTTGKKNNDFVKDAMCIKAVGPKPGTDK